MRTWIKRILYFLLIGVLVIASAGFAYETIIRQKVRAQFPVQGSLIDIGGRKMQLDCRGMGLPTVILESGFDYFGSLSWFKVHDALAKFTRTCAYSRAGIMWSEPDPRRFNVKNIATDLHALLSKAKIDGPFVIVGHSLGGPLIMQYTNLYGAEIKGLVFVDVSHPDQVAKSDALSAELGVKTASSSVPPAWLAGLAARLGIVRLFDFADGTGQLLPEKYAAAANAYFPEAITTILTQLTVINDMIAAASQFRQLGNRPLIVLSSAKAANPTEAELAELGMTREKFDKFWVKNVALQQQLSADEASWSNNSRQIDVSNADHYIHLDNPGVVIQAVSDVVTSVRTHQNLKRQ